MNVYFVRGAFDNTDANGVPFLEMPASGSFGYVTGGPTYLYNNRRIRYSTDLLRRNVYIMFAFFYSLAETPGMWLELTSL